MTYPMKRVWAMPTADTFDCKPIGEFVRKYLVDSKISIDPFARNKLWCSFTNDLNPDTQAEVHWEASDFLRMLAERGYKADLVLFDPPYSLEQCKRSYESVGRKPTMRDTQIWGRWTEAKNIISDLLEPDGIVLTFGWHSSGMGKKRGFEIIELLLVCHGGAHNDTICLAERRVQGRLSE
jgi:hypothetical protein